MTFDAIDLVITDLNMPMRGDTAVQVLRARGLTMPVILMSGDLRGDDIRRLRGTVDFFMQKPFAIEEMLRVVGELLGEARGAAAADPIGFTSNGRSRCTSYVPGRQVPNTRVWN